jgi:hypothetical protein
MTTNSIDNNELTDEEVEQVCGIVQAPHCVTLEQMEEAIKSRVKNKYVGLGEVSAPIFQNQTLDYANANPIYND